MLTIAKYFKSFRALYALMSVLLTLLSPPVTSELAPVGISVVMFPPIGGSEFQTVVRAIAIIFGLLASAAVFFTKDYFERKPQRRLAVLVVFILVAMALFILYAACNCRFVRVITQGPKAEAISVGYERSADAATYVGKTDWEMFEYVERTEKNVQKLFTFRSLCIARSLLMSSYFLCLCALISSVSLVVLFSLLDVTTSPLSANKSLP